MTAAQGRPMQTRRGLIVSMAGALTLVGSASAETAENAASDEGPKPTVIPGKPPILDYGEGVKVPAGKGAFLTLWEGQTFWLTFGFGSAAVAERAKGEAVHHAIGAMKYLLLTLAFAPDRLQKVEGGGWRQKVEDPSSYVLGELELPGHPGLPLTDAFMGFGNADANLYLPGDSGAGIGPNSGMPGSGSGITGMNRSAMLTKLNAFCTYIVKKKDLSLADVRARAKLVQL
jgi:hypothetical protein